MWKDVNDEMKNVKKRKVQSKLCETHVLLTKHLILEEGDSKRTHSLTFAWKEVTMMTVRFTWLSWEGSKWRMISWLLWKKNLDDGIKVSWDLGSGLSYRNQEDKCKEHLSAWHCKRHVVTSYQSGDFVLHFLKFFCASQDLGRRLWIFCSIL